jgi:hypothetical protein
MKKLLAFFFISSFMALPMFIHADEDDLIQVDTVTKHDTGSMLDSGTVEKVEKPAPEPTRPEPTAVPTPKPAPTERPVATEKPVVKPTPKPAAKKVAKKVQPTPVPTAIPAPAGRKAEFSIVSASAEELAKKRNLNNCFGLLDRERKFRMIFTVQNTGDQPSLNTSANIVSGNTSIIVSDKDRDKDLQTVPANDKRELTFEILILGSYEGDNRLPLSLKMKYNGVEKDYPLDISVEPESPVAIYAVIASVILLIIIIIILISRRGKNDSKNKKDYDFEMK